MRLSDMRPGQQAVVSGFLEGISMEERLRDLGFIRGTTVVCVAKSPLGDPCAYMVRGAVIAIREQDSKWVEVREVAV